MAISQRSTRNRRPINPAQQWQPQLVTCQIQTVGSFTIQLILSAPIQLSGKPAFSVGPGSSVEHVELSINNQLDVYFDDHVVQPFTLTLPAWDPAMRTASGGYMAPVNIFVPEDFAGLAATPEESAAVAKPEPKTRKKG